MQKNKGKFSDVENSGIVAGYVRRSSKMQEDNLSMDAQKRGIAERCDQEMLSPLVFYVDDLRTARTDQEAKRPAFKKLLEDVEAGKVKVVIVHTLDRWSRNLQVALKSFQLLAEHNVKFISLSEQTDYSTPEGKLQLSFLSSIAAYYSDNLSTHTKKGKEERAVQGYHNGDIPFGYRRIEGTKGHLEIDPETVSGLRMIGELRMQGWTAKQVARAINEAGYRTGSKRFGQRPFTIDTINAITRNEFYCAFAPGDDRGTILYKGKRYRGQHAAVFTVEEWGRIRTGSRMNYNAPHRAEKAVRIYEFSAYIICVDCLNNLRCKGGKRHTYYKDMAANRQLHCSAGGFMQVRTDLVNQQFGELLKSLDFPLDWKDEVRQHLMELAVHSDTSREAVEIEKKRRLARKERVIELYMDGLIDREQMQKEISEIEVALKQLVTPQVEGISAEDIIRAGEELLGMAAVWNMSKVNERRDIVTMLLTLGGLHYDLPLKMIAAIEPRPVFLPVLKLAKGLVELNGYLISREWLEQRGKENSLTQLSQQGELGSDGGTDGI
jgi:site-specific DNA recombinase